MTAFTFQSNYCFRSPAISHFQQLHYFQCTLSRLIERMFDTLQQQTFHFSPNYVTMPNLHLPVLATLNITLTWVTKPLPYFTERHAQMQCLCNKGSKPQGIVNKLQHKSVKCILINLINRMICMQFVVPITVKEIPKLVNSQIFKSLLAIQLYENCVAVVHVNVCWF